MNLFENGTAKFGPIQCGSPRTEPNHLTSSEFFAYWKSAPFVSLKRRLFFILICTVLLHDLMSLTALLIYGIVYRVFFPCEAFYLVVVVVTQCPY